MPLYSALFFIIIGLAAGVHIPVQLPAQNIPKEINIMKKILALLLALSLCLSLAACAKNEPAPETPDVGEPETIVNPMTEETPDSLLQTVGIDLSYMQEYEDARFFLYAGELNIAEVQFSFEGKPYRYRVATPAAVTDISGLYYQTVETSSEEVGYNPAALRMSEEMGDISWYDIVPGVQYDLSCTENPVGTELTALANKLYVPVQGEVDGLADGFLQDALRNLTESYFPGSSGSSLTGAACAAALADLFTEEHPSAEAVEQEVLRFGSALSAEDQVKFAAQLMGVKRCFDSLAQNGIGILEDAGAVAAHYPWDNATVSTLFAAMALSGSEYAYAERLADYAAAIRDGKDRGELTEAGLNFMVGDLTAETVGYCFEDLDNDGIKELILGAMDENDYLRGLVLELDTVNEFGFLEQVFMSGERNRLYTVSGSTFNHVGSSGADDSFEAVEEYSAGQLTEVGTGLGEVTPRTLQPLSAIA